MIQHCLDVVFITEAFEGRFFFSLGNEGVKRRCFWKNGSLGVAVATGQNTRNGNVFLLDATMVTSEGASLSVMVSVQSETSGVRGFALSIEAFDCFAISDISYVTCCLEPCFKIAPCCDEELVHHFLVDGNSLSKGFWWDLCASICLSSTQNLLRYWVHSFPVCILELSLNMDIGTPSFLKKSNKQSGPSDSVLNP